MKKNNVFWDQPKEYSDLIFQYGYNEKKIGHKGVGAGSLDSLSEGQGLSLISLAGVLVQAPWVGLTMDVEWLKHCLIVKVNICSLAGPQQMQTSAMGFMLI